MISLKQWRYMLLALLAIIALAAFSACGDDDDDDGGTSTAEPSGSAEPTDTGGTGDGRIQGGDMVVQGNEFDSLDPHYSSFAQDISLHRMIWRGLYWLNADDEVTPAMAANLPEVSADGKTYTVTLKDGLQWSDGDDLTAEDFVAGIQRTCNPNNAGQYEYILVAIVGCDAYYTALGTEDAPLTPTAEELDALRTAIGVTAVDDTTVEFTLTDPQPTFPILLALWPTFPVPSHLNILPDDAWPTDPAALAYNGPYMLTEYTPQDHVKLVPNPNWSAYNGITPTLDSITVRFIDDTAVADDAYRTGELSFANADTAVLSSIVDEFGLNEEYFKGTKASTRGLEMNLERAPLDNLEVRLALSQALDRQTIVDVAVQGAHQATTSWIPEVVNGGDPPDAFEECCGFNPESAAAHLEAAGYPGGAGFPELKILIGDSPAARATAEIVQQSLNTNLGINVGIDVVDAATRSARFTSEDFDLFLGGWIQDYPDPENWIIGLFDTDGPLNHYNCSNPEIDALIEQARFNPDNAERVDQYNQVNALISETVCGIAPYWHEANHYLIKPNVVGMRENIGGQDAFPPGDWIAEAWGFSE